MQKFRALLAGIPLIPLLIVAVFLGLAPFRPAPHLWEKLQMLANGSLTQLVDIGDLLMHGLPVILLVLKLLLAKKPA